LEDTTNGKLDFDFDNFNFGEGTLGDLGDDSGKPFVGAAWADDSEFIM